MKIKYADIAATMIQMAATGAITPLKAAAVAIPITANIIANAGPLWIILDAAFPIEEPVLLTPD